MYQAGLMHEAIKELLVDPACLDRHVALATVSGDVQLCEGECPSFGFATSTFVSDFDASFIRQYSSNVPRQLDVQQVWLQLGTHSTICN